jgi:hypothetical protein
MKTRLQMWVIMAIAACSPALKRLLAGNSRRPYQAYTAIGFIFSGSAQILVLRC